jgi:O-acetyl-ADP-ribose deacetylase (regulator of RNase III)
VQQRIEHRHAGELLVGMADIVETGDTAIPYLIVAPTMRVPMKLGDSVNPYLAARAIFLLVTQGVFSEGIHHGEPVGDHIRTVAMPGLGTGVGSMGVNTCAHQLRAAINDILLGGVYNAPHLGRSKRTASVTLYRQAGSITEVERAPG